MTDEPPIYFGPPIAEAPEGTLASTLSPVDGAQPTTVEDVRAEARRFGCTCTPEITFLPGTNVRGISVRHAQVRHWPTCALLLLIQ